MMGVNSLKRSVEEGYRTIHSFTGKVENLYKNNQGKISLVLPSRFNYFEFFSSEIYTLTYGIILGMNAIL